MAHFKQDLYRVKCFISRNLNFFLSRIPFRAVSSCLDLVRKAVIRYKEERRVYFWSEAQAGQTCPWPALDNVPEAQVSGAWLTRMASRLC